jgi:hypothetical protein
MECSTGLGSLLVRFEACTSPRATSGSPRGPMRQTTKTFLYYMSTSLDLWGLAHTHRFPRLTPFILSTPGFMSDGQALRADWYSVGADLQSAMIADVQKKEGREWHGPADRSR